MSDSGRAGLGSLVTTIGLVVAFLLAGFVFVSQSSALSIIKRGSSSYLLARMATAKDRSAIDRPDRAALETALVAAPLNSAVVSAAVFDLAMQAGPAAGVPKQLALLPKLGWRNTVALQNVAYDAVARRDLTRIADIGDALLRRRKVEEQATALMRLMELAPQTRKILVTKLAADPVWRTPYLMLGGLQGRQQAEARYKLAMELNQSEQPLRRNELITTARMLVTANNVPGAYRLWLDYRKVKPQPLSDGGFAWAYRNRADSDQRMPFEWELQSGIGYWSEVIQTDDGQIAVSLNWDGKGVPVLLSQQTAIEQTPSRLVVMGPDLPPQLLDLVSFALRCPSRRVVFDRVVERSNRQVVLATGDSMPCSYPVFEVAGRPDISLASRGMGQSGLVSSYNFVFSNITLR